MGLAPVQLTIGQAPVVFVFTRLKVLPGHGHNGCIECAQIAPSKVIINKVIIKRNRAQIRTEHRYQTAPRRMA